MDEEQLLCCKIKKKINSYLTQLKHKCQFLAFFHIFDKLFGTIYMMPDEIFVESFSKAFSKHFVHLLNVILDV